MSRDEPNTDRIASWLDGDNIALSESERALADEIRRDQMVLDTPIDRRRVHLAMDHARRRMTAELARPSRRKQWLAVITSTEAIAVAALLVVTILTGMVTNGSDPASLDAMIRVVNTPDVPDDFDLVQDELDALEAELFVDVPGENRTGPDSVPLEFDERWLDEEFDSGT